MTLTRYGADIEWNMNLLLRPGDFQREMQLKLSAQEESLRAALVRIGYDLLMTEGTDLVAALINSNPHFRSNPGAAERSAERIYTSSVFGAMAKVRFAPQCPRPLRFASHRIAKRYSRSARSARAQFPFPVENLMAAAKHASASTIATAPKTVMIIPQGLPELHKYTKYAPLREAEEPAPRSAREPASRRGSATATNPTHLASPRAAPRRVAGPSR